MTMPAAVTPTLDSFYKRIDDAAVSLERGEFARAIDAYQAVLDDAWTSDLGEKDSSSVVLKASRGMGKAYLCQHDYERAIDYFSACVKHEAAFRRHPFTEPYMIVAQLERGDDPAPLLPQLRNALWKIQSYNAPDFEVFAGYLGRRLYEDTLSHASTAPECETRDGYKEAWEWLCIATRDEEASAVDWNNRGVCEREMGMSEAANISFGRAVRIDPDFARPHYNMAQTFMQLAASYQGEVERALRADVKLAGQRMAAECCRNAANHVDVAIRLATKSDDTRTVADAGALQRTHALTPA